jgi:hypothetical protein
MKSIMFALLTIAVLAASQLSVGGAYARSGCWKNGDGTTACSDGNGHGWNQ